MFLAIDVGNTNVHIGLTEDLTAPWLRTFRFSSARDRTADEWRAPQYPAEALTADDCIVAMCSVVPAITRSLTEYVEQRVRDFSIAGIEPATARHQVCTDQPRETGTDRLTNAVAVDVLYGRPAIVVDFGTATKVDALDADGRFLEELVATDLGVSMDALASRAAICTPSQSRFRARQSDATPHTRYRPVVLGHLKMVEGLVEMAKAELGSCETVVLTGGNGALFSERSSELGPCKPTSPSKAFASLRSVPNRRPGSRRTNTPNSMNSIAVDCGLTMDLSIMSSRLLAS
ncbi:MAG: type III pantothenate kinase [Thermomicrobiales bacterium]